MLKAVNLFLLSALLLSCSSKERQIREFVKHELAHYPGAGLADLYKSYFQDAYGPGHLIPDTTQAGAYLGQELKEPLWGDTLKWQALGTRHDFYRINLSLVKEGRIPRKVLLEAMVKSASLARKPDIADWREEWAEVVGVIRKMGIVLPGFEEEEKAIEERLVQGEVTGHHSRQFVELYHPHYRIIHRTVFEEWKNTYLKE